MQQWKRGNSVNTGVRPLEYSGETWISLIVDEFSNKDQIVINKLNPEIKPFF